MPWNLFIPGKSGMRGSPFSPVAWTMCLGWKVPVFMSMSGLKRGAARFTCFCFAVSRSL